MNVLEVRNLSKSFGKTKIINDISFHVGEGEIVGFVGPNGTGKTTTLKMISNLIWPDQGEIEIAGYNLFKEREKALSNLAGIVENPGLYQNLSGRDNLKFIQKIRGVSKERLDEVIEITGLKDRLDRKVKKYSLGMKQRLALGMCILTKPKFLILDEPTNGLDPTGTFELRQLIERMAKKEQVSILFSSHMLGEVEKLANRVIYIKEGRIISEKEQVRKEGISYSLLVNHKEKAVKLFEELDWILEINTNENNSIKIRVEEEKIGLVLNQLCKEEIIVLDMEKEKEDLEDVYNQIFLSE
ncbi:ABC transporter ATP-binding protein [Anaeromicropila herbilytica]|uniref:ABC transporter ATP-binding protein n=1 Tax=Anaeromicropila herbilytica TaxID=2785025 RepID=A0A7R7EP72_9FIRM|nr:ATP-binding cassette domain-containing protein [Anaeromicropila herbilytica]BCN32454.1 ABC transporter ATP-binding protein [Anaeromicropila herbilytica]